MELYRIAKPTALIINKPIPTIRTTDTTVTVAKPHLFNTMEEYNALAKQGRFQPSKALLELQAINLYSHSCRL